MKDLKAYSEDLNDKLRNEQPFGTFNRDITHAAVITRAGFQYASSKVRLLSHKLDSALYDTSLLKDHAIPFLDKEGASLHILVETDVPNNHPIWDFIQNGGYSDEKLTIKRIPSGLVDRYKFNYLVVDDFGFRFERNREEYAAVASFHERDSKAMIEGLVSFFDDLEERSSDIRR